jgi:hypothetical protein
MDPQWSVDRPTTLPSASRDMAASLRRLRPRSQSRATHDPGLCLRKASGGFLNHQCRPRAGALTPASEHDFPAAPIVRS